MDSGKQKKNKTRAMDSGKQKKTKTGAMDSGFFAISRGNGV